MSRPAGIPGTSSGAVVALLIGVLPFAAHPPAPTREPGPQPPRTTLYGYDPEQVGPGGFNVRTVCSPVLFTLPSWAGYSRVLLEKKIVGPQLSFPQPIERTFYLQNNWTRVLAGGPINGDLTRPPSATVPGVPAYPRQMNQPEVRRLHMSTALHARLLDGATLPAALNQPVEDPWKIRAALTVSSHGLVEHVFVDQPLSSPSLNHEALRMLYTLRFKPGEEQNGWIEIHSPPGGKDAVP